MKNLLSFWKNKDNKGGKNNNNDDDKDKDNDKDSAEDEAKKAEKKAAAMAKYTPEVVEFVAPQRDPTMEQIGLKVTSSKDPNSNDSFIHVSIKSAEGTNRTPLDVCCVVDVSGSMSTAATLKNDAGQSEGHGLSILDVVKHSVKTIIHSLEACDRIAVVAFESSPHLWFPLTQATENNKEYLDHKIDEMQTMGGTDLWKGLQEGMDLLYAIPAKERALRFPTLLVLTDGIPDYNPEANLSKYKDVKKFLPNLNTFGFGYSLQTPMLLNIAQEGHGMHAFIPDASFVGTAFVNSISNLMATNASNVTVSVEAENGLQVEEVYGHSFEKASWGHLIYLNTLQYGQTKDIVFRVTGNTAQEKEENKPAVTVTLKYETAVEPKEVALEQHYSLGTEEGGVSLQVHKLRLELASKLLLISKQDKDMENIQKQLLDSASGIEDPHAKGILEDIKGQVKEAIQLQPEDYYHKWGLHYLPSLSRAHLLQQCNNFKDPGIQFYGGSLFHAKRDTIEDIFIKLPPPKPSQRVYGGYGGSTTTTSAPLASMAVYYNAGGGCIAGECVVSMADGSQKRVDQIVKGDKVSSSKLLSNSISEVVCVVKTHCYNKRESLVTLPTGLRLTPYHPVRSEEGIWRFPLDLAIPHRDAPCDFVYNFVLCGEKHAVVVNGVECITLGHGLEGDVVGHPYFGTQAIVDDLRKMNGFAQGCVELYPAVCGGKSMVRNEKTGLVCGFVSGVDGVVSGHCEL